MMSNKVRSIRTFILLSLFIGVFLSIIQSLGYFAKFDAIFYGSDLSVQNQDFLNPDGVLVIALFAVLPGIAIILWGSEKGLICAIGCLITYYGGAWLYWKHLALMLPLVAPTVATLLCVVRAFGWRPVLVVDETPERSKASLHPPVQKTGYDVFIIMKSIFLSHVSEDSTIGLDLADELGKEGFTVWSYERDYIAGTSYLITTREAIDECKALVILISDDSIKSHQIDVELEHAHEEARPIFPVRLGVTDAYYKGKKPSWAQMIGTRTSTPISEGTVPDAAQRLCTGFRKMGIRPSDGQPKEKETVSPVDSKWSKNPEEHKNEKVSPRPIRRPKTMVCILESAIFIAILAFLLLIWQTKSSVNRVAFTVSPPMNTIQTFDHKKNTLTLSCDERNGFLSINLPDKGRYRLGLRVPPTAWAGSSWMSMTSISS